VERKVEQQEVRQEHLEPRHLEVCLGHQWAGLVELLDRLDRSVCLQEVGGPPARVGRLEAEVESVSNRSAAARQAASPLPTLPQVLERSEMPEAEVLA
jgi:hypothetical protein